MDKARREQHRLRNPAAARSQSKSYLIPPENASLPGLPAPQATGNRDHIGAAVGGSNADPVEHLAVDPLLRETELILRDYTQLLGPRATRGVADSG